MASLTADEIRSLSLRIIAGHLVASKINSIVKPPRIESSQAVGSLDQVAIRFHNLLLAAPFLFNRLAATRMLLDMLLTECDRAGFDRTAACLQNEIALIDATQRIALHGINAISLDGSR